MSPERPWQAARRERKRATALIDMRRYADAVPILHRAIALEPHNTWSRNQLARCLEQLERYDEALHEVDEALAVDPESEWSHRLRGVICARQRRYTEAAWSFREAVRIDPESALAWQAFNYLTPRAEFADEVLGAAREAVRLRPDDAWMWFTLGRANTRDPHAALAAYRQCLALDHENEVAHNNLGWIHMSLGDLDEAERCFQRSIELVPAGRMARSAQDGIARVARLRGDSRRADELSDRIWAERLEQRERAAAEHPGDPAIVDFLVEALWRVGRRDEAWEVLRAGLRRSPDSIELLETLAGMASHAERFRLSIYAANRALGLDPRNSYALQLLGTAQLFSGRQQELEATALRLAEIAPGTAAAERALCEARLGAEDWDGALAYFRRAQELAPLNTCSTARVGVAQARAGDLAAAEETWLRRERLYTLDCGCAMMRVFADLLGKELPV